MLAVFDETLQKEALTALTERETKLVAEGLIAKEMTTVMLSSGVKEVGGSKTHSCLTFPHSQSRLYTLSYLSSLTHPLSHTVSLIHPLAFTLSNSPTHPFSHSATHLFTHPPSLSHTHCNTLSRILQHTSSHIPMHAQRKS